MNLYQPPNGFEANLDFFNVFLAGTIDDGNSDNWQKRFTDGIKHNYENINIFNPRREDWNKDATEEEKILQIQWELTAMEKSDFIFYRILPESKSPITLMEIGLYAKNDPYKMLVLCPKEFYRYINVREVCHRYKVKLETDPVLAYNHLNDIFYYRRKYTKK